ncbi:c-type cytochrome domain-containing protein [Methylibium sp.]|uniref:c-type cytochrome domain-containing protein n=1 Tax=Methylibium sp. TaxID=2067992 RepID=UPI003D13D93D
MRFDQQLGSRTWRWLVLSLICSGFALMGQSAAAEQDNADSSAPSFSRKIQPIFDANCVACHQSAGASGGLNLEEGAAYSSIVSRKSQQGAFPRIVPGKPEDSYLIRKLEGTHVQVGGSGERMPPTGSLDSTLIGMIRNWVTAGAKSD